MRSMTIFMVVLAASLAAQIPGSAKFPSPVTDSDLLCASNNFSQSLLVAINSTAAVIQVPSAVGLCVPSHITIGSASNGTFEIVRVVGKSGGVLSVIRGQEGTAAIAHQVGERVENRATAEHHNALAREVKAIAQYVLGLGVGGVGGGGIVWRGPWSSGTTYAANDAVSVTSGGITTSYVAIASHTNSTPPSPFWNPLASGSAGPSGAAGSKLYIQAGAPSAGTGIVGDWSIDQNAGALYEKTGTSTWTARGGLVSASTTGNAATASALAATPTLCAPGTAARGIDASGNSVGCLAAGGGGGVGTSSNGEFLANSSGFVAGVPGTGSGNVVRATSPTLVTPALGTPSSVVLSNATGLPVGTGISGLASGIATFLGTPSSANLAAALTDEVGTGAVVFESRLVANGTANQIGAMRTDGSEPVFKSMVCSATGITCSWSHSDSAITLNLSGAGGGSTTATWEREFTTRNATSGAGTPLGEFELSDGVSTVFVSNSGVIPWLGTTFEKNTGTPSVVLTSRLPTGYTAGSLKIALTTRTHPRGPSGETNGATGNVVVQAQAVCLAAADNANTDGAQTAANGTVVIPGDHRVVFTEITLPDSGCAAGEALQVRVERLRTNGGDTFPNTWILTSAKLVATTN